MEFDYIENQYNLAKKRIFFSDEHKVAFFTTPKCGGSFVKAFFLLNFTEHSNDPLATTNHQQLTDKYARDWMLNNPFPIEYFTDPSIKKFQIVRNPLNRAVSFYWGARRDDGKIFHDNNPAFQKNLSFSEFLQIPERIYLTDKNVPEFKDFGVRQHFNHSIPQFDWLYSKYFQPLKLEEIKPNLSEIFSDKWDLQFPNKDHFRHHVIKSDKEYIDLSQFPFRDLEQIVIEDNYRTPKPEYFLNDENRFYLFKTYTEDFLKFAYDAEINPTFQPKQI